MLRLAFVQAIVPRYRVPLFDALSEAPGIDLTVLADGEQPEGSLETVPHLGRFRFEHTPWRQRGPMLSQPGLLAAARSRRFDAIVMPWNTRVLQLFPAIAAARRRRTASILFGHGFSKREGSFRRWLRNVALARADCGVVYVPGTIDRLVSQGVQRGKLVAALNAIDQRPVQAARSGWLARPESLADFRREHGIHDRELAVFLSRIEPDKGVDILLRAFALLRRTRPNAKLAVIGKGSHKEAMERLAVELGLGDSVIFPGAIYDDELLAPWMLSAAVFAYPIAIGLSILHAFGYGLPVVTSDDMASHNPEVESLRPGQNGLLYRDGDLADFAAAMGRCMDGGPAWDRMSAEALATVTGPEGFNVERMAANIAAAARQAAAPYTRGA